MSTVISLVTSLPVINILISDPNLIKDWIKFCDALRIDNASVMQWKEAYNNTTMGVYELFRNIVHTWLSQNTKRATLQSLCERLKKIDCIYVAECLEEEFGKKNLQSINLTDWPLWFNITKVNRHFVGRSKELSTLGEICNTRDMKIIVISGLGGIGKTELVRKSAHDSFNKGNVSCTWFNGESKGTLYQSLKELALKLGICILNEALKPKEFEEIAKDVVATVRENRTAKEFWMVIIDNVDEHNSDLETFLQLLYEMPDSVSILTTRNIDIFTEEMYHIVLDKFTDEDAVEFFKTSLNIKEENNTKEIKELCDKLGNYALAMNQTAAYIVQQKTKSAKGHSYGISDYLKEYNSKAKELLEFKLSKISNPTSTATFITWDISILKLQERYREDGVMANDILNCFAYLDPTDIKLDFVSKICNFILIPKDEDKLIKLIELLKKYSLIKCEDCVVSIHRLVQEVIRIKLIYKKLDEPILSNLIQNIATGIKTYNQYELDHAICVSKYASENENIMKQYSSKFLTISDRLYTLGFHQKMKEFSETTHTQMTKILGENHYDTLKIKGHSAWASKRNGDPKASVVILEELWKKQNNIFGQEDDATFDTGHKLAAVLVDLGRLDEGIELAKELLKIVKDCEQNQEKIMSTKTALARGLSDKGNVNQGIEIFKQVFAWLSENDLGGMNHSEWTLFVQHNIAQCLYRQGNYLEAKEIFENALINGKKLIGKEHPGSFRTRAMYAITLFELGEKEKAVGIINELLIYQEKVLKPEHSSILSTRHNIAYYCLFKEGKWAEARVSFENVFESRKKVLGDEHPLTLNTKLRLAETLNKIGVKEKALEMFKEILESQLKVLNPEHPHILATKENVKTCLEEQGIQEMCFEVNKEKPEKED